MRTLADHRTIRNLRTVQAARTHREFEKYDTERLRLAASQPTSDFDKVVEEVKRIEHSEPPKPKKPGRKKKGVGG
jgi:hypothetical protein